MPSTAASTPRSRGTEGGSEPSTSRRRLRATRVADGLRPRNEKRLHRSPCSTDSRRNPGPSPTRRPKAATGVTRSASTSRHTGTTVWSRASARKASLLGSSTEAPGEAGALARVAGAPPLLLDHEQEDVPVAVVEGVAHPLAVAAGVALGPDLLAGAAPEDGAALGQGPAQRVLVHPRQHQHRARARLLDDGRDEAPLVVAHGGERRFVRPERRDRGCHRTDATGRPGRAPLQIEAGGPVLVEAGGGHGVDVPLPEDEVLLALVLHLVAVLGVEQPGVARLDGAHVRAGAHHV